MVEYNSPILKYLKDMKNILVPTDFSACANNASAIGINLAKKSKAEIHFLHIVSTPVEWRKLPKEKEKNFPEILKHIGYAKAELSKWVKKAEKQGLKAKQFMVFNADNDEILKHLKHHKHDFIVMGSHGSKGIKELLIGSNAQKIIRFSPVPVLVVKDKQKRFEVKNIVYASVFRRRLGDYG